MSQISLPITSRTAADDNLYSDVYDNDLAIVNVVNGALDEGNFVGGVIPVTGIPNASVTDAKLTSPNNHAYKLLAQDSGTIVQAFTGPGNYTLGGGIATIAGLDASDNPPAVFAANALLQLINGKTQKLLTAMSYCSNSTASGITVTGGLYPITTVFSPSAGEIAYTLGTVISGSTVAVASAAGAKSVTYSGADINLPAAGTYCLGVNLSGIPAVNSVIQVNLRLLTHNL